MGVVAPGEKKPHKVTAAHKTLETLMSGPK